MNHNKQAKAVELIERLTITARAAVRLSTVPSLHDKAVIAEAEAFFNENERDPEAVSDDSFADTLRCDRMHNFEGCLLNDAKTRGDLSGVAERISRDRYGAGTQAAVAGAFILLTKGRAAFTDFLDDLSMHEESNS